MKVRVTRLSLFVIACLWIGCGGRLPNDLGVSAGRLADCPSSPNCVSSFAEDELHGIEPIDLRVGPEQGWVALREVVAETPRVEIVLDSASHLHAVYTSRLMRYRDDVEFLLDSDRGVIEVRSASRVGYGDMGVNRERVEAIRASLAARGVVRAAPGE